MTSISPVREVAIEDCPPRGRACWAMVNWHTQALAEFKCDVRDWRGAANQKKIFERRKLLFE